MHVIKHFLTITKHRHEVIRLGFKCRIKWQVLFHDLSKYSFKEFFTGAKYYNGKRSPNAVERDLKGYSEAWLHHKGRNKHHYEYWIEYDSNSASFYALEMPLKYLKEMFCDRIAATKIYHGKNYRPIEVYNYYIRKNESLFLHHKTKEILENWFAVLVEKGEKEALKAVKNFSHLN